MSGPAFAVGDRVRYAATGETGRVTMAPIQIARGTVIVHVTFDGADHEDAVAASSLEPAESCACDVDPELQVKPADLCAKCGQPHWFLIANPNVAAILCPDCDQAFETWADEHPDTPYNAWLKAEETVR